LSETDQKFQKRQTAYKTKIKDILSSKYIKTEGFAPNYLEVGSKEISRINIIGFVVEKPEVNNYKSLIIDDGTGKISAGIFENNGLLDAVKVGDAVVIIGRPREFSSEKYILIEAIKKVDSAWTKVRSLELRKNSEYDGRSSTKESISSNDARIDVTDLTSSNKIIQLIKGLDKGDGVSVEDIMPGDIEDKDKIVDALLKDGDIFEIKPGKLKVLE